MFVFGIHCSGKCFKLCRVLKFHRILERICCQKSFHTSQFLPLSIWLSRLQCTDSAHSTLSLSRRHVSNQKILKTSSMNVLKDHLCVCLKKSCLCTTKYILKCIRLNDEMKFNIGIGTMCIPCFSRLFNIYQTRPVT